MGYAIAWERRRALLSVLVPVLVPAILIVLALRLIAAPEDISVLNGQLVAPLPDGVLGIAYWIVTGVAWLLGITAGVIAIGEPSLGTKEILKKAAKAFPVQAFWAVAAIITTYLVFRAVRGLGWFGVALLVVLAVGLAWFSLVLPSKALDGHSVVGLAQNRRNTPNERS